MSQLLLTEAILVQLQEINYISEITLYCTEYKSSLYGMEMKKKIVSFEPNMLFFLTEEMYFCYPHSTHHLHHLDVMRPLIHDPNCFCTAH